MSLLGSLFKKDKVLGTEPSIMTKVEPDPYKVAISTPLSGFLAKQIGQGIGEYDTDPNYTNRYNEYLSLDPASYFDKNIGDTAIKQYKQDFLPVVREGYAGSLRGSGRFGAEEAGINRFAEDLATTKSQFVPQFAKSQIDVGQSEFARRYANWYNGLAVNNPALKSSIDFLNSDSGYNILSALNPGKQGWFGDLLKAGAGVGASFIGG